MSSFQAIVALLVLISMGYGLGIWFTHRKKEKAKKAQRIKQSIDSIAFKYNAVIDWVDPFKDYAETISGKDWEVSELDPKNPLMHGQDIIFFGEAPEVQRADNTFGVLTFLLYDLPFTFLLGCNSQHVEKVLHQPGGGYAVVATISKIKQVVSSIPNTTEYIMSGDCIELSPVD